MSDTVNVPKVGAVKKSYVYVGVGTVAAFVLWRYWSAAGAAPEVPGEYQPDTSSITQTGAGPDVGGSGRTGNTTDTSGTDGVVTTNDQWTQKAVDLLGLAGFDERTSLTALGKWLSRQPLTDAEAIIVRAAKAVAGPPPQGGDFPINLVPGGNTGPAKAEVPRAPSAPTVSGVERTNVVLNWGAVPNATAYQIDMMNRPAKRVEGATSHRWGGLTPGKTYSVRIRAWNKSGYGPYSPMIKFTTKKG